VTYHEASGNSAANGWRQLSAAGGSYCDLIGRDCIWRNGNGGVSWRRNLGVWRATR